MARLDEGESSGEEENRRSERGVSPREQRTEVAGECGARL